MSYYIGKTVKIKTTIQLTPERDPNGYQIGETPIREEHFSGKVIDTSVHPASPDGEQLLEHWETSWCVVLKTPDEGIIIVHMSPGDTIEAVDPRETDYNEKALAKVQKLDGNEDQMEQWIAFAMRQSDLVRTYVEKGFVTFFGTPYDIQHVKFDKNTGVPVGLYPGAPIWKPEKPSEPDGIDLVEIRNS